MTTYMNAFEIARHVLMTLEETSFFEAAPGLAGVFDLLFVYQDAGEDSEIWYDLATREETGRWPWA